MSMRGSTAPAREKHVEVTSIHLIRDFADCQIVSKHFGIVSTTMFRTELSRTATTATTATSTTFTG